MATTTGLVTVEQYRQLPEIGPFYYELHHGEIVRVTRPKMKHARIQRRLRILLEVHVGEQGIVEIEVAFRALPEYELRVADVAYVARDRWEAVDPEDNLHGAPELVIEILSDSNTVSEINTKEELCLQNGSREFWVVDSNLQLVKVSTPDGITTTYHAGQEIPLAVLGGGVLKVEDIFG